MKAAVAKAVLAFQTIEEYNIILFQWYFKGFELLRRYLMKHGPGTNLENLDFEAVDKKLRRTRRPKLFRLLVRILLRLTRVATTHLWLNQASLSKTPYIYIYIYFFFWCPICFWAFVRTIFLCSVCFGAFEQFASLYM